MATNPEPTKQTSTPSSPLAVAGLAIALYIALIDAAVETFRSGSPVRWWVVGAVAVYLALAPDCGATAGLRGSALGGVRERAPRSSCCWACWHSRCGCRVGLPMAFESPGSQLQECSRCSQPW